MNKMTRSTRIKLTCLVAASLAIIIALLIILSPSEIGDEPVDISDVAVSISNREQIGKPVIGLLSKGSQLVGWTSHSLIIGDVATDAWREIKARRTFGAARIINCVQAGNNAVVITSRGVYSLDTTSMRIRRLAEIDLKKYSHIQALYLENSGKVFFYGEDIGFRWRKPYREVSNEIHSVDTNSGLHRVYSMPDGWIGCMFPHGESVMASSVGMWLYNEESDLFVMQPPLTFSYDYKYRDGLIERIDVEVEGVYWAWPIPDSQEVLLNVRGDKTGDAFGTLVRYDAGNNHVTPLDFMIKVWGFPPFKYKEDKYSFAAADGQRIFLGSSNEIETRYNPWMIREIKGTETVWRITRDQLTSAAGPYTDVPAAWRADPYYRARGHPDRKHNVIICRGLASLYPQLYYASNIGLFEIDIEQSRITFMPEFAGEDITCIVYHPDAHEIFVGNTKGIRSVVLGGKPEMSTSSESQSAPPEVTEVTEQHIRDKAAELIELVGGEIDEEVEVRRQMD